jgi:hypothetical protein
LRRDELDPRPAWRPILGAPGPWLGEDMIYGLHAQFASGLWLEDPDIFSLLAGRPALFLANHQVAVESLLFATAITPLLGVPMNAIAKQEHRESWIGQLFGHFYAYPGIRNPDTIQFVRLGDPQALLDLIGQLTGVMNARRCGMLVHVAASRVLSCRDAVRSISGVFLDLALRERYPIVPVKFRGGLPVEALEGFLDFPVGYGAQTFLVGRPIMPETLDPMALLDRRTLILDRINGLGGPPDTEEPAAPDPAFKADLRGFMDRYSVLEPAAAAIWAGLRRLPQPSAETEILLRGIEEGRLTYAPTPVGRWIARVARWLTEGHLPTMVAAG